MTLQIALDTNSSYVSRAGTSRYVRGLLEGLRALAPKDMRIRTLAWEVESHGYQQPQRAFCTAYRECVWANLLAPGLLRRRKADLLHRCILMPIRHPRNVKEVVTLYDMALLRHPERYRRWARWSGVRYTGQLQHADHIVAISRFAADEYLHFFPDAGAKVSVVYLGGLLALRGCSEAAAEIPKLPEEFFLFVGSIEPGKNLALLRGVYGMAERQGIALPPLVIVGSRWEGVPQFGPTPKGFRLLGHQPDDVLLTAYRRALALVFPSRYEGFGLPVLEAMALDCPVVCSRVGSLPEVGGRAAWYVDMTAEAYLKGMLMLLHDHGRREELVQAGREQSRRFSWLKCAAETTEIYRHVLR